MTNTIKYITTLFLLISIFSCNNTSVEEKTEQEQEVKTLKSALSEKFYIGGALNADQILGKDTLGVEITKTHFNSIVAENCMKSESLQPKEGKFDFALADKFVEFGVKNNMKIIGHTLIWHSQTPPWFFIDENGKDVSREVMIERMKTHISTVVGRYKGKVKGWDVVNEALNDDGTLRESKFLQIIGEDYLELAYKFAHEADPEAELYYNDYLMYVPAKRDGAVKMVKNLLDKGAKINGIGMQAHCGINEPSIELFEEAIVAYAEIGVQVMITELDVTVLPMPDFSLGADINKVYGSKPEYNLYTESLPDSMQVKLTNQYVDFFKLFVEHSDKIDRVTFWGVHDNQSWKNNWPIKGRTDYPLLFDRNYKAKPAVEKIINLTK